MQSMSLDAAGTQSGHGKGRQKGHKKTDWKEEKHPGRNNDSSQYATSSSLQKNQFQQNDVYQVIYIYICSLMCIYIYTYIYVYICT